MHTPICYWGIKCFMTLLTSQVVPWGQIFYTNRAQDGAGLVNICWMSRKWWCIYIWDVGIKPHVPDWLITHRQRIKNRASWHETGDAMAELGEVRNWFIQIYAANLGKHKPIATKAAETFYNSARVQDSSAAHRAYMSVSAPFKLSREVGTE